MFSCVSVVVTCLVGLCSVVFSAVASLGFFFINADSSVTNLLVLEVLSHVSCVINTFTCLAVCKILSFM